MMYAILAALHEQSVIYHWAVTKLAAICRVTGRSFWEHRKVAALTRPCSGCQNARLGNRDFLFVQK
jgi:hypothetical protein